MARRWVKIAFPPPRPWQRRGCWRLMRGMYDQNNTIANFLTAAAAKQPAPGGGSATALAGALAAAMGEMVVNYSVGKKDLVEHQPALQEALAELTRARGLL